MKRGIKLGLNMVIKSKSDMTLRIESALKGNNHVLANYLLQTLTHRQREQSIETSEIIKKFVNGKVADDKSQSFLDKSY